jgi:hypothetical protein
MGLTSLLTWLFVTLSAFGAPSVGGGGPIPKPHTSLEAKPAVGGGGPIARALRLR